jgi:ribosomal 50S subunit-associated protein YjgA (DUF615 family)
MRKKAKGCLPYSKWLQTHGHGGLAQAMRNHPEAFAHIEQERRVKTVAEHVKNAEALARHHRVLPCRWWLVNHEHSGLVQVMYAHPEAFAHVKQEYRLHTLAEHVKTAEALAKKHKVLPCRQWLRTHGHSSLDAAMHKHPEAFAHIKQEWQGGKTLAEHVKRAEALAKKHKVLPYARRLMANGHHGLVHAMRRHPEAFAHIKRDRR